MLHRNSTKERERSDRYKVRRVLRELTSVAFSRVFCGFHSDLRHPR
jgi:hypothetical protein